MPKTPLRVSAPSIVVALSAVAAIVLAAVFIYVNFFTEQKEVKTLGESLVSVSYSQSQAVEGFDDSEREITDGESLAEIEELIEKYDVDLENPASSEDIGCTGGVQTTATFVYGDESSTDVAISDCNADEGTFEHELTELLRSYSDAN